MKYLFISAALALSITTSIASAQAQRIAPPVSDVLRQCDSYGCQLVCTNEQGAVIAADKASNSIRTIMLSNGNTEFRIDDGSNGLRTTFVSQDHLICKISGER